MPITVGSLVAKVRFRDTVQLGQCHEMVGLGDPRVTLISILTAQKRRPDAFQHFYFCAVAVYPGSFTALKHFL